jgi:hypothetical protein
VRVTRPFQVVSGLPVFLSNQRYGDLLKLWREERGLPEYRQIFRDTPEERDFQQFQLTTLRRLHREDRLTFVSTWVEFDLQGPHVDQEAFPLIGDSCAFHRRGGIVPVRLPLETSDLTEWVEEAEFFPAGRTFLLAFESRNAGLIGGGGVPASWTMARRLRHKAELLTSRKMTEVLLTIRTAEIYRMVGTLADFTVYSGDFVLRLAENVEIRPSTRPGA